MYKALSYTFLQVHVENPSAKLLEYRVLIRGESSGSENFAIIHSNDTIVVRTLCLH